MRGSHRWGFFKPNVFVSQMAFPGADGDTLPDIDGHEEEYDIVSYELEPGDMLVHHHLTVHGSAGNATLRQTRRATFQYLVAALAIASLACVLATPFIQNRISPILAETPARFLVGYYVWMLAHLCATIALVLPVRGIEPALRRTEAEWAAGELERLKQKWTAAPSGGARLHS